jgi:hypothetical protein
VEDGSALLDLSDDTLDEIGSLSGTLTIDLKGIDDIQSAAIPAEAFLAIAGADGITALSIGLTDADVTFDAAAMAAIAYLSDGPVDPDGDGAGSGSSDAGAEGADRQQARA